MPIESIVTNSSGEAVETRRGRLNGRPRGLVTYTHELYEWPQRSLIPTNETYGRNMAVDGSTGGTTEQVYDGGDTAAWTATATVGTWLTTDTNNPRTGTAAVRAFNMNNGDILSLAKGSDLDMTNYNIISGWIDITRINDVTQQILISAYDNSVLVGNTVNIIDYVDGALTGTYQRFVIPKDDLGIGDVNIDELQIEVVRPSGSAPQFDLDDIEVNETGGVRFTAGPVGDQIVEYDTIEITLSNASYTNTYLDYDQILGVASLANGIVLQRISNGVPRIAVAFRTLRDFLSLTYSVTEEHYTGAKAAIKLTAQIPQDAFSRLDGNNNDSFNITINDDLTGLDWMSVILIGRELDQYSFEDDQ